MFPLIAGLLSGGASLIGSIFSSRQSGENTQNQIAAQQGMQQETEQFNAQQAQVARDFSANQADIQRGYETQMSNTAYQRASADMKAAGLNPMMMFGSGGPSSTPAVSSPSGVSASVGTPSVPMPQTRSSLGDLGQSVSQAINSMVTAKTVDKMSDEIANLKATQGYIKANTDLSQESARLRGFEATREALAIPGSQFSAKSAEDLLKMPDWLRTSLNIGGYGGNKVSDVLAPILNSAGTVRRFLPTRSTEQRSFTDSRGYSSDSFSERFNGIYGNSN